MGASPMRPAANESCSGTTIKMFHFMNGVARSFDAGLSLAALARLGGAVGASFCERCRRPNVPGASVRCGESDETRPLDTPSSPQVSASARALSFS
jgi:hypothetical protein